MSIVTKLCIKMNAEQEESSRQKIIKLTSRLNSRLERMEDLYKEVLPIKFSDLVSIQDAEELIRNPEELADFISYFKVVNSFPTDIDLERQSAQAELYSVRDEICRIADDLEARIKNYHKLLYSTNGTVSIV